MASYTFAALAAATNSFNDTHRIADAGAFGPVYRGLLGKAQPIAVKQLQHPAITSDAQLQGDLRNLSYSNSNQPPGGTQTPLSRNLVELSALTYLATIRYIAGLAA